MGMYCYCEKGHLVASVTRTIRPTIEYWARKGVRIPEPPGFCFDCGAPTITKCKACSTYFPYKASYCGKCGKPLPWTEYALTAAREYTDEVDDLDDQDKLALKGTFEDLTIETARTPLAASRFIKLARKGGPLVLDTLRSILVDVIAETASKVIMAKP